MANLTDRQRMNAVLKHGFLRIQTGIPGVFKPMITRKEFDNWLNIKRPISKRWAELPENKNIKYKKWKKK